jgi:hypothetical protein
MKLLRFAAGVFIQVRAQSKALPGTRLDFAVRLRST